VFKGSALHDVAIDPDDEDALATAVVCAGHKTLHRWQSQTLHELRKMIVEVGESWWTHLHSLDEGITAVPYRGGEREAGVCRCCDRLVARLLQLNGKK
jgi:hypothetical protein